MKWNKWKIGGAQNHCGKLYTPFERARTTRIALHHRAGFISIRLLSEPCTHNWDLFCFDFLISEKNRFFLYLRNFSLMVPSTVLHASRWEEEEHFHTSFHIRPCMRDYPKIIFPRFFPPSTPLHTQLDLPCCDAERQGDCGVRRRKLLLFFRFLINWHSEESCLQQLIGLPVRCFLGFNSRSSSDVGRSTLNWVSTRMKSCRASRAKS